ncbi:hypothetical protein P7C73_g2753, partial [Tremellales sp. Uapishka_1]
MLWRFSFASTSTLDALLSRETPPSLEELLDEQEILSEVKAQNNKLVTYLSREDSIKSLLQWVISGLDELDQEAAEAFSASVRHASSTPDLFPSYRFLQDLPVPGPGPNSPPLEPAKMAEAQQEQDEPSSSAGIDPRIGFSPGDLEGIGLGQGLDNGHDGAEDEVRRQRYPHVATEILTSEGWTISETVMSNKEALLRPFWEAVLSPSDKAEGSDTESRQIESERERARDEFWSAEDEERDRKREIIRGLWFRVNNSLLTKRTTEMMRFIQTIPNVIERLVARISSPSIQDILVRIVSTEEAGVKGVIEWLGTERLIPRLLALLSPQYPTSMHQIASETLKSIITLCAPSPFNPHGGTVVIEAGATVVPPPEVRDNSLIRELVSETSIKTLYGFMLDPVTVSDLSWKGLQEEPCPADPFVVHPLPSVSSVTSALSHVCSVIVELIRRNNSDFSEPQLLTIMDTYLKHVEHQWTEPMSLDEKSEKLEVTVKPLMAKMGIVHLGNLLAIVSSRFSEIQQLLHNPRAQDRAASTSHPKPLTMERFRIVELYAELLHSSNMSILNRTPGTAPLYTPDGLLVGGLDTLSELRLAVAGDRGGDEPESQITQAKELPVSSGSTDYSLNDEDVGSDDGMLEDVEDDDLTPGPSPSASVRIEPPPPPSQENVARLRDVMGIEQPESSTSDIASVSHAAVAATTVAPSVASEDEERPTPARDESVALGDQLKQMYIKHRVLPTVVDLFFEYPNNDFLHHVVYDLLQQILNGRLGPGWNRELVIELIREAKLIEKILDAQRINDRMIAQPKTPRMAYMGHIVLIAEELVKFFDRCPPELWHVIKDSFVISEWEAFVEGSLRETKAKDARPLAGGKPMPMAPQKQSGQVDEDSSSDEEESTAQKLSIGEPLARTSAGDGFGRTYESYVDQENDDDDSYWTTPGGRGGRNADSSDDDDDWPQPGNAQSYARQTQIEDLDDDDAWGTFTSASSSTVPAPPAEAQNPFADDSFAPLTPHDWATAEFDREFGPESSWPNGDEDDDGAEIPAIVVPTLNDDGDDDDGLLSTPTSSWSFTGEDEGEDLPPTLSPTFPDVNVMTEQAGNISLEPPIAASHPPEPISTPPPPPQISSRQHPTHSPHPAASIAQRHQDIISPPEPHLVAAATEEDPLGPGVSGDTTITPDGMLQREIDGEMVTVPQDEVARGIEDAIERKAEDGLH